MLKIWLFFDCSLLFAMHHNKIFRWMSSQIFALSINENIYRNNHSLTPSDPLPKPKSTIATKCSRNASPHQWKSTPLSKNTL